MATLSELTMQEHLQSVREIAEKKDWEIEILNGTRFFIKLFAADNSSFALVVDCHDFPAFPPSFHWCDPITKELDQEKDTPKPNGYFHGHAVICAPWNRLAYKSQNPKGPHNDWEIGNWQSNPKTGGHRTLSAMLIRINYELKHNFKGRMK